MSRQHFRDGEWAVRSYRSQKLPSYIACMLAGAYGATDDMGLEESAELFYRMAPATINLKGWWWRQCEEGWSYFHRRPKDTDGTPLHFVFRAEWEA